MESTQRIGQQPPRVISLALPPFTHSKPIPHINESYCMKVTVLLVLYFPLTRSHFSNLGCTLFLKPTPIAVALIAAFLICGNLIDGNPSLARIIEM